MTRECLHIWLMPWAEFIEPLEFGNVKVWDFYKEGPVKVPDSQEMLWLAQFMSCFRDSAGKDMKNMAVMQLGPEPFALIGDSGNDKMRWASDAICFAHMTGSIRQFVCGKAHLNNIGSSERYQAICMVIDEGILHYNYAGVDGTTDLAGKYVVFNEPPQLILKMDLNDRLLMEALARINDCDQYAVLRQQLAVCFEWFSGAWKSSPDVSFPARYIFLLTSFESLIRQGQDDKMRDLADRTLNLCEWTKLPETESFATKKGPVPISKARKFIYDFADYRNVFAHGSTLPFGLIRHCIGNKQFLPMHVMSAVIYCMVCRLLLQAKLWEDLEAVIVQKHLKDTIEALEWHTLEPMQPSPHEAVE